VRPPLLSVVFLVAAFAWEHESAAQTGFVEAYEAPDVCPDAAWFEAELQRRLPGVTPASGALRIRVEGLDDGFVGTIRRGAHDTDLGARDVRHGSCAQVVDALALIGALWLAPDRELPADTPAPEPVPATPPPPPPRVARAESAPSTPVRIAHGPSLGVAAQALVAPSVGVGPRLAYGLSLKHARSDSEIRLAWTHSESGNISNATGASAELVYSAGQLRLCEAIALLPALWFAAEKLPEIAQKGARLRQSP
jgi:hypothetical protein